MRILIDLQACQTVGSRHRGIGRYSMALAQAMVKNAPEHEFHLLLNAELQESILAVRKAFAGLVSPAQIHLWQAPAQQGHWGAASWANHVRHLIREQAIVELQPDVVHISSLFEGLGDESVTSVGWHSKQIPTAVTLYDLIPYIYQDKYLQNPDSRRWYMQKLQDLKRADLLLAISASSRQEAIDYLGIPESQVTNISAAVDARFHDAIAPISAQELRDEFHISRQFIMYTGGIDQRKNIPALIRAYAALPLALRQTYQLAIVCNVEAKFQREFLDLALAAGAQADDIVFTGYVEDQDLPRLYSACYVFIFPSWHEGFGLPALEAMTCGAPVIAANTSSLPEVVACDEALFDPFSDAAISTSLQRVLEDQEFHQQLRLHAAQQAQKFSWDQSAKLALRALENLYRAKQQQRASFLPLLIAQQAKPKLAFIGPVPPLATGIADYNAELLPDLARYYEIEIISDQTEISLPWLQTNFKLRTLDYFRDHAADYQRVVYQMGNSAFHQHMPNLLNEFPGVVVLHDFYLSNLYSHLQYLGSHPGAFSKALFQGHGYAAVLEDLAAVTQETQVWKYPCSQQMIAQALGVVVHSAYSAQQIRHWYPDLAAQPVYQLPHLRVLPAPRPYWQARQQLGIRPEQILVCAFGLLGPTKLNQRLLEAWQLAGMDQQDQYVLVFVGQNDGGKYGQQTTAMIAASAGAERIQITGFASPELFQSFLQAADVAVQLRTMTRGETSGTVLDCLAHGVATIVNAHGSMRELPDQVVCKVSDACTAEELANALQNLTRNQAFRQSLAQAGIDYIRRDRAAANIASQYASAIESIYLAAPAASRIALGQRLLAAAQDSQLSAPDQLQILAAAQAISANRPRQEQKRLLVDVSWLAQTDAKSGIQRVVRAILLALAKNAPSGYRVEPVYLSEFGLQFARRFAIQFFNLPDWGQRDEIVEPKADDVFLGLDLNFDYVVQYQHAMQALKRQGVRQYYLMYDLIPVLHPDYFHPRLVSLFKQWLHLLMELADGIVCISDSVRQELRDWIQHNRAIPRQDLQLSYFHLGADLAASAPTQAQPEEQAQLATVLAALQQSPTLLMVGTLEPRKDHSLALDACELLWQQQNKFNLVIVGKAGWQTEQLAQRIRQHPQYGKQLFWLEQLSDEGLQQIYAHASALLMNSVAEGFGLPLIEAAAIGLDLVLRDIPVFREVASDYAFYFTASDANAMARDLSVWLDLQRQQQQPRSAGMQVLSWQQSCQAMLASINL